MASRRTASWVLLWCLALSPFPLTSARSSPARLERTNLLSYRNAQGDVVPVKTVADWQKRRGVTFQGMQTVMGLLPGKEKRGPLDLRVEEEVDCDFYVRRFIRYASEPNARVPAYLLIPKQVLTNQTKA